MKERPILFSGPMVRALLDGSKTQTRRVVKSQPPIGWDRNCWYSAPVWGWTSQAMPASEWHTVKCPFGEPGDRLWVRETFLYAGPGSGSDLPSYREERANPENHKTSNCWFRASRPDETLVWTPSIHMPRWASRLALEVTCVRVERLQDISEDDAKAEGARLYAAANELSHGGWSHDEWHVHASAKESFIRLWDGLATPGSDWNANPWVWVVEFKRAA